jgi:hypothetical protein
MSRKSGGAIADAVVNLRLSKILDVTQIRPFQIRLCEDGASKIRKIKNCIRQISSRQISAVQPRMHEIRTK